MFNIDFLHVIREFEYKKITEHFGSGACLLEIGGGTGYQAKRFVEDGYDVESIDIPDSNYAEQREFPVQSYDGRNIPFPDSSFDIVFSSNVLEHVSDFSYLQNEIKRVLRPNGICVHVMPTGSWRFWTNIAHYTELMQRLIMLVPRVMPSSFSKNAFRDSTSVLKLMAGTIKHYAIVPRHGEIGNALTEIYTFSSAYWKKQFKNECFSMIQVKPSELFYTGHMVLGPRLSISLRRRLARYLGSACVIYIMRKN